MAKTILSQVVMTGFHVNMKGNLFQISKISKWQLLKIFFFSRYQPLENGKGWINSISYCAGANNECKSKGGGAGIRTVANVTLANPGVLRHEYDSALSPQVKSRFSICVLLS